MRGSRLSVILLVGVTALLVQVQALSSKRVAYKIRQFKYRPLEKQQKDIETNGVKLNENEFVEDDTFKAAKEDEYFKMFASQMDRLFKRYEDERYNDNLNLISRISNKNKKSNYVVESQGNYFDLKNSNDETNHIGIENNSPQKKNEESGLINDKKSEEYEELYKDESNNEYIEKEDSEYMEDVEENDDETLYEDSEQDENEINKNEDGEEFLERNEEDRKNKEFAVFDYLVASEESEENNNNKASLKDFGKEEYDGDFIPDDYFDNSDYEA